MLSKKKKQEVVDTLRVWVDDWAQVKRGEKVLIVTDPETDKLVLDTVTALARERGAKVTVCEDVEVAYEASGSHVDEKYRPMSDIFYAGWKAADLVLTLGGVSGHHNFYSETLMVKYPTRSIRLGEGAYDPKYLTTEGAKYPREILKKIGEKVFEIVRNGTRFHFTHPLGTDLWFTAFPGEWGPSTCNIPSNPIPDTLEYDTHKIGRGVIGYIPTEEVDANGIVVSSFCKDIGGNLSGLMKLTFVDGWCEEIEGGEDAERFKKLMGNERNNRHLQELMFGLNPKISAFTKDGKITYLGAPGAGNIHVAIGREIGKYMSSQHLTPAFLPKSSLYVDGQPLMEKGRLMVLDLEEVREVARKYGDPDQLLSQVDL